jgi:hypothetical protein
VSRAVRLCEAVVSLVPSSLRASHVVRAVGLAWALRRDS